jgi:GAF domain-containing protein
MDKPSVSKVAPPFKVIFTLRPLIKYWEKIAANSNPIDSEYAKKIIEELKKAPELYEPIENYSVLEKHKSLVEAMLGAIISPASKDFDYYAAIDMKAVRSFYETPHFKELNLFEDQRSFYNLLIDSKTMLACTIVGSYANLLRKFYNINVNYEFPLLYSYKDKVTGLERHVRVRMLGWFVDYKKVGDLEPISEPVKKKLFENLTNPEVLEQIFPYDKFEIEGFMIFNAVDITDQQIMSSMKYELMQKDTLMPVSKHTSVQDKFRALMRKPDLRLGLVSLPGGGVPDVNSGREMGSCFILQESCLPAHKTIAGSLYERVIKTREVVIVHDLTDVQDRTPIEDDIIKQGIRNLFVAPLLYNGEVIGLLELGSPNPGDLNTVNTLKLGEILEMFATCFKTGMEDLNRSIQAVIKEKCTAIHPSVEWRFRKAALDYLKKTGDDIYEEMEDIVFENVYPLYGVSDIRDSSRYRNASIQADLIDNLNMANDIITSASKYEKLPVLDELSTRIKLQIREVEKGLSSGDEANILNFLHTEVVPLFAYIEKYGKDVGELIENYNKAIDSKLGFLYRKRKEFDDCVMLVNETISAELDNYEEIAQKMFPHYFEKYKTDGVEHTMYIGASLAESREFNLMYLKNLRLWQIMTICGIARRCKSLKDNLKIPLEATHLILVQNSPLSIRFHYDEKKFDVDGTYNIRYEILKKRIDKAEIKGSEERLTQPGKIAIVYSRESEAAEYKLYIDYLKLKGYLLDEVEYVDLQDMQGVHGLKAIRVTVNTKVPALEEKPKAKDFDSAVKAITGVVS